MSGYRHSGMSQQDIGRSGRQMPEICRVYWGHAGCDLPRGHDPNRGVRTHRQLQPTEQSATVTEANLFGEDLTEEEQRITHDLWE